MWSLISGPGRPGYVVMPARITWLNSISRGGAGTLGTALLHRDDLERSAEPPYRVRPQSTSGRKQGGAEHRSALMPRTGGCVTAHRPPGRQPSRARDPVRTLLRVGYGVSPSVTVTCCSLPLRWMVSCTWSPALLAWMAATRAFELAMGREPARVTTSPFWSP